MGRSRATWLMCRSKRAYRSAREAWAVAMKQRVKRGVEGLRVYRCPLCARWHLTHRRRCDD